MSKETKTKMLDRFLLHQNAQWNTLDAPADIDFPASVRKKSNEDSQY